VVFGSPLPGIVPVVPTVPGVVAPVVDVVDPVDDPVVVAGVAEEPVVLAGVEPLSVVLVVVEPVADVVVIVLPGDRGVAVDVAGVCGAFTVVGTGVLGCDVVPVVLVCAGRVTAIGFFASTFAGADVRDAFVTGSLTNVTPDTSDFLLGSGRFGIRGIGGFRSESRVYEVCATAGVLSAGRVLTTCATAGFFSGSRAVTTGASTGFLSASFAAVSAASVFGFVSADRPKVAGVDGFWADA
jgi:hypothetical protein